MSLDNEESINTCRPGTRGICPHCQCIVFFAEPKTSHEVYHGYTDFAVKGGGDHVHAYSSECPNCLKPIVAAEIRINKETRIRLIHPFGVVRLAPSETPEHIKEHFQEAAAVLQTSEKASAALSRRCLQSVLLSQGAPEGNLDEQIGWALKNLPMPSELSKNLDYVRHVGNFAAHEIKYLSTGEIVDVEPEEASWNLDVLEILFEYCYVQPSQADSKRAELQEKLKKAGKTYRKDKQKENHAVAD